MTGLPVLRPDELDLARIVRAGDLVTFGQGCAEPLTLTRRLLAARERIGGFGCFLGVGVSETFAPERCAGIGFTSYGAIGTVAALSRAGRLCVVPSHYSRINAAFATSERRADVVLLQLAPPREPGGPYSLSLANDYAVLAARHARVVVAEINPDAPWTYGAELPPEIRPDILVAADHAPAELAPSRMGPAEARIAAHVAGLVPDGACLQFGVGAVPFAVLSGLSGHRDLGIHSGILGDVCVDLIEGGAVTNARKAIDPGLTVTNIVLGTRRLFRHLERNPAVLVRPAAYTHDSATVARNPTVRAINSAVEVDLTGQVNAEVAGGAYVGAVGGQVDFIRGALASPGGRSIIALPATARGGTASRIVPAVAAVTALRSDADLVVTEFGIADLRGATLDERARRMIAVAAPAFRDDLARAWQDR